jgi:hypothetical protein
MCHFLQSERTPWLMNATRRFWSVLFTTTDTTNSTWHK